jgi:hypothetical protein
MKVMIMMLLPFAAFSQLDTIYLEWKDDKFYEVSKFVFEDGRRESSEKPIGDTSAVVNYYYGGAASLAKQQAEAMNHLWMKELFGQNVSAANLALMNEFGITVQSISAALNGGKLVGEYVFIEQRERRDASIQATQDGLMASIDTINYPLYLIGEDMFLLSYDNNIVEMYRVIGQDAFMSMDRQLAFIRKEE